MNASLPKLMLAGLLFLVALVCGLGSLASLEPSATAPLHTGWFLGYSTIGLVSLGYAIYLAATARRFKK